MENTPDKFDRIFTSHYNRLFYFALNMLHDADLCHDILDDIFMTLWNNFDGVKEDNITSYLFTSVRNRVTDQLRRGERHRQYTEEYIHTATEFYTDYSEELEKDKLIEQMFAHLNPPTDQILEMCYIKRMKYAEVAEALSISPNTVKKHISKALKILRELYKGKKDTLMP